MATQMQRRTSARVLAELVRQASGERYWQHQVWREGGGPEEGPRPLEFDARGFPVAQRRRAFMQRVGRLLNGS